jgi:hypothetical protein
MVNTYTRSQTSTLGQRRDTTHIHRIMQVTPRINYGRDTGEGQYNITMYTIPEMSMSVLRRVLYVAVKDGGTSIEHRAIANSPCTFPTTVNSTYARFQFSQLGSMCVSGVDIHMQPPMATSICMRQGCVQKLGSTSLNL